MPTALITGASGGIGLELAAIHASKGGNLIIVARSKEVLDSLKQDWETKYGISVYSLAKDLTAPKAAEELYQKIKSQNLEVDYLINNAGFGDFGLFYESGWEKMNQMLQLNIMALTQLTRLYAADFAARGSGKIMNVASTAAFQPVPTMAVYSAAKAYVLSLTEALQNEMKGTGVTVTALCPGPTKSGFQEAANMDGSNMFKEDSKIATSKEVAQYGYKAMMKGKPVAIHGLKNYLLANSVRLAPRSLVVKIARWMTGK